MKKAIIALIFLIGVLIMMYVVPAYAAGPQVICHSKEDFPKLLKKQYSEVLFWSGKDAILGGQINMYLSKSPNTFTITIIPPMNPSLECIMIAGKNFEIAAPIKGEAL